MIKKAINNRNYSFKFNIGDIVRIKDSGELYGEYIEAMYMLNVNSQKLCKKRYDENICKQNWLITNVIVSNAYGENRKIYAIRNKYGEFLIIGERGLVKRTLNNVNCSSYKEKNEKPINVLVHDF